LVVGEDDVRNGTVGVNARGSNDPERGVAMKDFIDRVAAESLAHASPEVG